MPDIGEQHAWFRPTTRSIAAGSSSQEPAEARVVDEATWRAARPKISPVKATSMVAGGLFAIFAVIAMTVSLSGGH